MSDVQPSSVSPSMRNIMLGLIPSFIINGAIPLIIYLVLKHYNYSELAALSVSAVFPLLFSIAEIVWKRSFDLIAIITLIGIAVSIIAIFLGGDPKLLLIRESFLTGALGIVCFISLLFPRPLMFYFGRYFAAGKNPVKLAEYNGLWQHPYFRFTQRLITVVWGVAFTSEFILRVVLVYTLSPAAVLAVSPFIFNGITIATIVWTIAYATRAAKRGAEMRRQHMAQAPAQQPTRI